MDRLHAKRTLGALRYQENALRILHTLDPGRQPGPLEKTHRGEGEASSTSFLIPPVSLALGVLVRGEHVALLSIVGAAVCLAGAWLMRRAQLQGP